jgi:hypothetical protein
MRLIGTALLSLAFALPALAQTAGSCALGTAAADLDISDVRARLYNKGNLFFDGGALGYFVPQGTGRSPVYAAGLWLGGTIDGFLRTAAATYTQAGADYEFYPGPLGPGATLPMPDCRRTNANGREAWDRIYVVSVEDIEAYEQTGVASPSLEDWPVGLGAPAVDAIGQPVVPASRDQLVDLAAGERPALYGSETAFWVMNDVGGPHATTGSPPLGVEVQVSAFAVSDAAVPALDQSTFYRYRVVNRNDVPLENTFLTFWADPDLGNWDDDYVGSDSTRGMGYVYNGDNFDETAEGYGTAPPAIGFELLGGASGTMYYDNSTSSTTGNPTTARDYYNYMRARWKDGTPLTEGGDGYDPSAPPLRYAFPGAPEATAYWSEVNTNGSGAANPPGDRRLLVSSLPLTLQPGEARDFDVAIVYARGTSYLNSVTALRTVSDLVQTRYDGGSLFGPLNWPAPPTAVAQLLAPEEGASLTGSEVTFEWTAVAGTDYYALEISDTQGFENAAESLVSTTAATLEPSAFPASQDDHFYWRVRAGNASGRGPASETRSLSFGYTPSSFAGGGAGIVETSYPGVPDVCAGAPADPGCAAFGGNTVWLDPNSTADYLVTAPGQSLGIDGLGRYIAAATPDDYELRFTEACADFGACLGFYGLVGNEIASVPFELWNVGTEEGAEDDVRMIPILYQEPTSSDPALDWADTFEATQQIDVDGDGSTEPIPVSHRIYWMMPDREDGYVLFEAAASAFGGPGAVYDQQNDGDDQVDLDPYTGGPCLNQGAYVDYCYKGAGTFVYPIGRLLVGDLTGDGTTPPAGTTVRLRTTGPGTVAAEPSALGRPETYALLPVSPNPLRSHARVPLWVPSAGYVRVAVYDLLGREVAVLVDGPVSAGRHEAAFEAGGLASGVYVVVLEAEGAVQGRQKVLVLR